MPYRVFHVEDDAIQALVVAELLAGNRSLELRQVETAADALAGAPDWAPQLLLLDHELPDGQAPSLLAQLRQQGVQAPAILLTAHRLAAPPEGFAAVLSKPLDFGAFRALVERFTPAADPGP